MADWIEVGKLEDIPRLGARVLTHQGEDIAVFRCSDDEIYALKDHCPHKGGPLSQGIVHGKHITCPLHNWVIGFEDGEALAPDEGCAAVYPVKVEQGIVYLNI